MGNSALNEAVKSVALTGNEAVANAMRQVHPDVVAAYPITPQTEIVQIFSTFVADGLVQTEFVPVESEHSAMSATVGASAAGARAMTATSANGLALMWEVLYIAAGLRLPIVMPVVNRALSAPINIHCDHSDTMGARDSGWIQLYSENAQEAYDNVIQAVRIAEHPEVNLPVMVMMDGFIISHGMENVYPLADEEVRKFVGERKPHYTLLDADNPITVGPLDLQDFYFEHRRQQAEAMFNADKVVKEVADEFAKLSGRQYDFFEAYQLDDAEMAIVVIGSTAGTAKYVVNELRAKGVKAGLLKIRMFRPFPAARLREALTNVPAVAVMDRADSLAACGGPLFGDLRAALYSAGKRPLMNNYIYGLGGRDVTLDHIRTVYQDLEEMLRTGEVKREINYLGVRE
ncbi:MAG: pyruvate ferredoxin oxidoreductase [Limnochordia bacterium]|jgi:pyruvate ferredoxin oxidoreductase alpha subunit|nr:pyruvate ferredoxin oxidoreductase [Bacillota bacterium]